jgi:hypothetical protein
MKITLYYIRYISLISACVTLIYYCMGGNNYKSVDKPVDIGKVVDVRVYTMYYVTDTGRVYPERWLEHDWEPKEIILNNKQ